MCVEKPGDTLQHSYHKNQHPPNTETNKSMKQQQTIHDDEC